MSYRPWLLRRFWSHPLFSRRVCCSLFKISLDFGLWMIHIQLCLHRMHAAGRVGRLCIRTHKREKEGDVEKSINQSLGVRKHKMCSQVNW